MSKFLIFFLGENFERYYCNNCSRSYKYPQNLKLHQRIECGKSPQNICTVCGRKFHHKGNLFRHMGLVHKMIRK